MEEYIAKLGSKVSSMKITVKTIDAVQGAETDISIISFVRSNERNNLGFLRQAADRALVALSRAREYVFMVQDVKMFKTDDFWRAFHSYTSKKRHMYNKVYLAATDVEQELFWIQKNILK